MPEITKMMLKPLPSREPDIEGKYARAWKMKRRAKAEIETYLIQHPTAHAFWEGWIMYVVHLREEPGVPAPIFHYPEAKYEFASCTLNPEEPAPDIDADDEPIYTMCPADAVVQFHGLNDAQAAGLLEQCVIEVCEGRLSPDSDYRRAWKEVVPATAKCIASGTHPNVKTN